MVLPARNSQHVSEGRRAVSLTPACGLKRSMSIIASMILCRVVRRCLRLLMSASPGRGARQEKPLRDLLLTSASSRSDMTPFAVFSLDSGRAGVLVVRGHRLYGRSDAVGPHQQNCLHRNADSRQVAAALAEIAPRRFDSRNQRLWRRFPLMNEDNFGTLTPNRHRPDWVRQEPAGTLLGLPPPVRRKRWSATKVKVTAGQIISIPLT